MTSSVSRQKAASQNSAEKSFPRIAERLSAGRFRLEMKSWARFVFWLSASRLATGVSF
jgi:hypothetical protein